MAKAEYSTKNIGHYGLDFKYYTHFTAPIRRYPDLMVHRLLKDYLAGKPSVSEEDFEPLCQHSSEMERKAELAERESVKYKQVEYMQERIGEEFDGVVTGASEKGTWVRVFKPPVEGKVVRGSQGLDIGDRVRVKLLSVDPRAGFIDFARR